VVSKNGRQKAHIRNMVKKAGRVIKQVWGIGNLEEIGRGDYGCLIR